MRQRLAALAVWVFAAVVLAGCEAVPPPAPAPGIVVHRVSTTFFVRPSGAGGRVSATDAAGLVEYLRRFGGGRLDAVHLVLPLDPVAGPLFGALTAAGVNPRKVLRGGPAVPGTALPVLAIRFVAEPPPCPPVVLSASGFGPNLSRPDLGCALLANLAAQVSDPADLLFNPSVVVSDPDRATSPITRLRAGPSR